MYTVQKSIFEELKLVGIYEIICYFIAAYNADSLHYLNLGATVRKCILYSTQPYECDVRIILSRFAITIYILLNTRGPIRMRHSNVGIYESI